MQDADYYIDLINHQANKPTSVKPVKKILNKEITQSSLFITEELGIKYIYKISDPKTALHTLMLSQLLLKNGITVPDSKIFIVSGQYFEKYEILDGTPASSMLAYNLLSHNEICKLLRQAFTVDKKISEINTDSIKFKSELNLWDRRKHHHIKQYGKMIANAYYLPNKKRMTRGHIALHHFDLNPSNILLDKKNNVSAILDLDSLAICNEYSVLLQISSFWPNIPINEIAEIYQSVFNYDIDMEYLNKLKKFQQTKDKIKNKFKKALTRC